MRLNSDSGTLGNSSPQCGQVVSTGWWRARRSAMKMMSSGVVRPQLQAAVLPPRRSDRRVRSPALGFIRSLTTLSATVIQEWSSEKTAKAQKMVVHGLGVDDRPRSGAAEAFGGGYGQQNHPEV